jgi:PAS domain S-box-containing protein
MNKTYSKIVLPTIFSILLFILTIFFFIIPRFKENNMNGKREMIKELTNSALSILSKYENDEREGLLTRDEAQRTAISRIQYLRYGEENKDYFWITDMTPVMIMHPFRDDLNGKDLSDFTDPHGKRLFVEFVNTVKKSEQGYVDYMWQWKDDSLHIVPKLSYVKIFKPWNWVIGTGVYIEDVKKEIAILTNRMIWISITISLLISVLLFYIIKQSLGIERKRMQAVNELHESKEKFRTLVEAATEGLIMLIDGKITFSNSVISKMTGYGSNELLNLSLSVLIGSNNHSGITEVFSENRIREGKFELRLGKKEGGFTEVLLTSSTTMLYDKEVNIIIVKDLTADKGLPVTNIDFQKLINNTDKGFFKARLDSKGKFLFANEKAIRILGFTNAEELTKSGILGMISDIEERKSMKKTLTDTGVLKNKTLRILKNNGVYSVVSLSMVVINKSSSDDLDCDGIIEDITLVENEKIHTAELITELKTNVFMLEQPVTDFISPVKMVDSDSTIGNVIHILEVNKSDTLLLTGNGTGYLGIITSSDIQKRVLSMNLNLDNPAYLIMSSPVKCITESSTILEAIRICEENKINHLVVKNSSEEIKGIFRASEVQKAAIRSLSFYISGVKKAETDLELKQCYSNLRRLVIPLIKGGLSVKYITAITSAFSDAVVRRLIELALIDFGEPPVAFAFIYLGSEGRQEETLFTDQDNAIIYKDVTKEDCKAVNDYFLRLGGRVCDSLNFIGYSWCEGNIMAKNPKWCKPVSAWETYFTDWISTPEPQNLLDATIFFDFRSVFGDPTLTETLRKSVSSLIANNPLFLYHLAYNTYNTKSPHISSGSILSDRNADLIDLKDAINIITMFVRAYSLQNNIVCQNTLERIASVMEKNILNEKLADEIIFSYNFLMTHRFRNQAFLIDKNLPISNLLNTRRIIDTELYLLKKVLSYLPDIQNWIKTDFRIAT